MFSWEGNADSLQRELLLDLVIEGSQSRGWNLAAPEQHLNFGQCFMLVKLMSDVSLLSSECGLACVGSDERGTVLVVEW